MIWALSTAVLIVAGATAAIAVLRSRLRVITVRGMSMVPSLRPGQRIVVRVGQRPQLGDLVVFSVPGRVDADLAWLVKRTAALPGQAVPPSLTAPGSVLSPGDTVPADCLVVAGDHGESQDSRHFGYVPLATVLGTMVRTLSTPARDDADQCRSTLL